MNWSRGKLLRAFEEDHNASEIIMGENDEGGISLQFAIVGLLSFASFLAGHFDRLLCCVRGVGSPGFCLGCASVSKIETFFNNSVEFLFLVPARPPSPCIHA